MAKTSSSRGKKIFWICFGLYLGVLVILAGMGLIKVWNIMIEYEDAQPENVLVAAIEKLEAGDTSMIAKPEGTKFEPASLFADIINKRFVGKKLTYKTTMAGSDTMKYAIYSGDEKIGNIELTGTNEKTKMAILKTYDWAVTSITTGKVSGTESVQFEVPRGYTVYVNDVLLTEEEQKGEPKLLDNMDYVKEYVTPPALITYKVSGLLNQPKVTIKNEKGEEIDLSAEENLADIRISYKESELPADVKEYVTLVAKSYSNFFSRDLYGATASTACIQPYFPVGSYYIELAERYRREDMMFYSGHKNPPVFKNFTVSEYTRYSDDLYSVRIVFDKSIYLDLTGVTRVEHNDQTYYFVNIDGKWVIADLITNVEE